MRRRRASAPNVELSDEVAIAFIKYPDTIIYTILRHPQAGVYPVLLGVRTQIT